MKSKFTKYNIFFLSWILIPLGLFAEQPANYAFDQGNALYAKGRYKEALSAYQQLITSGYTSAALFFNTGNCYYKLDHIPEAMLYYEKAKKLAPGDEDINVNIQLANLKTTDKIDAVPEFFLSRWWNGFILWLPVATLATLSIVLFLTGSALLIVYFFSPVILVKKYTFYSSLAMFAIGIISIFTGSQQLHYFENNRQGIVFSKSVTVKSSPNDQSKALFVIHEGIKVDILDTDNEWIRIRLPNTNEGWIKDSAIQTI